MIYIYSKKWEEIDDSTDRLKVPGGWIVRSYATGIDAKTIHQVFVEDSGHTWVFGDKSINL